jgi:hypothetical protein
MVFINKSAYYWTKPTFSFVQGGRKYESKKELILAVIARIGRDKPVYRDRFGKIALALVHRYSDGLGAISLMKSLSITDSGVYYGCGCGRIVAKKYGHDFECYDYEMEPMDCDACLISDWYTCPGCSKKRNGKTDPAKKEYGFDEFQWGRADGSRVVAMECCKKCRGELRRITRETKILADIRRLNNQLIKEASKHVTH